MAELMKATKRRLARIFSDGEKLEMGSKISEAVAKVLELKNSKKSMAKQMDAQVAAAEADIALYSEQIRTGREFGLVNCKIEYDWEDSLKSIVREDNDELIEKITITDDERQTHLELTAPADAAPGGEMAEPPAGEGSPLDLLDTERIDSKFNPDEDAEAEAEAAVAEPEESLER